MLVECAGVAVDGVAADLTRPGAFVVPFHRRLVLTQNVREAAKKVFFKVARPYWPYPPPLELFCGHIFGGFFFELRKKFYPPPF